MVYSVLIELIPLPSLQFNDLTNTCQWIACGLETSLQIQLYTANHRHVLG